MKACTGGIARALGVLAVMGSWSAAAAQETVIRDFIDTLERYRTSEPGELQKAYHLIPDLLDARFATAEMAGIDVFRRLDDPHTIHVLAEVAKSDDRDLRINASLILVNVVDNTTLCAVIDGLFDDGINDNARFNLLQIVSAVSDRALVENRRWIAAILKHTWELVGKDPERYQKSIAVLKEIEEKLSQSADEFEGNLEPEIIEMCSELPWIAKVNEE